MPTKFIINTEFYTVFRLKSLPFINDCGLYSYIWVASIKKAKKFVTLQHLGHWQSLTMSVLPDESLALTP